jgi:hypothetical protein
MLDSVFKEDIDGNNKEKILKFINTYKPDDTQTIISIADSKIKDPKIDHYYNTIFDSTTKLILIGNGIDKKTILKDYIPDYNEILNNSYEIMETI